MGFMGSRNGLRALGILLSAVILSVSLGGLIAPTASAAGTAWTQLGVDINGGSAGDKSGAAVSLSGDGGTLAVGAPYLDRGALVDVGHVRVFRWNGSTWAQIGSTLNGGYAGDNFGFSVALSDDGNTLAIGSPLAAGGKVQAGEVTVYRYGSNWRLRGSAMQGFASGDSFGYSVSLSSDGSKLAVGAPNHDGGGAGRPTQSNAGATYIYSFSASGWDNTGWIQGEADNDVSGWSVSLSGDGKRVAVGAPHNGGGGLQSGQVRVYTKADPTTYGSWTKLGSDLDGSAAGDKFGFAVSLSRDGTRLAAGAPWNDGNGTNSGRTRIYSYSSGAWIQIGSDIFGVASGDLNGRSVSLSRAGTTIATGATYNDGGGADSGSTTIYSEVGGSWTLVGSAITGQVTDDRSGDSVSLSSDGARIAIGAAYNDGGGADSGNARVFSDLAIALTPAFDTPQRTVDGFTVNVTNYDANYAWTPSTSAGSISAGTPSGSTLTLTVTGLSAGAAATATVGTTRSGYSNGTGTVSGQALSSPNLTWSPTTTITTVQSPLTPSGVASTISSGDISYSVTSHTTTACTVDPSTAVLTYSGTGNCIVRASVTGTSSYAAGSIDATFTVSKATQTVTWTPTSAVTTVQSPLTPSTTASALGGATVTYSRISNTTSTCSVDSLTGVLTFTGIGACVVRASAAATGDHDSGYSDVTFTISRATPTLTWNPVTSLEVPDGSTTFDAVTTSSDGTVTYAVTNAGTTGCSLPSPTSRTLSFTGEGSCQVTAAVAQTADYNQVTSVKTFAISKAVQAVTWSPSISLTLASLSAALSAASTGGNGAITYSVTSDGGTGCTFSDATTATLTYSAIGTCSVTATAAATSAYAQGTQSVTLTISLATPTITWSPTTALFMPAATVSPASATTSSDGAISYAVTSDAGANCSVNSLTGNLSYTATGQCDVTATTAGTVRFATASTPVTFTVSLVAQTITATASLTSLAPGGTATLLTSGSTGSGAITWIRTSGAGVCTLVGTTVTAVLDGICVISVDIAADSTYSAATNTVTITVTTPYVGGGSSGGSSGGGDGSTAGAPGATATSGGAVNSAQSADNISTGDPLSTDLVRPPGSGSNTSRRALPPPPLQINVTPLAGKTRAKVLVGLPTNSAGATVLSTVVIVRDARGKIVTRIELPVKAGQQQTEVVVPFLADGYTIKVYNVNEVGVSRGALTSSPLVYATTIARRGADNQPTLFGGLMGKRVIFAGASSRLGADDKRALDSIASTAKTSNGRLFVTGFARKGGGTASELAALSTARAKSVAMYLASRGVRVWIRYWGAGSLNGTGNPSDRRVEIRSSNLPIPRSLVP
jgi:hypothetical protein